jgi:hypothetical protein
MANPPDPLITAFCKRCHHMVGRYYPDKVGWVREGRYRCTCDPPPALPEGDELAPGLARAQRLSRRGFTNHSPVTIYV